MTPLVRGAAFGSLLAAVGLLVAGRAAPHPFPDAGDAAMVSRGRVVYATRCASCHGRYLQGQPLWRLADDDRTRRAPAQDGTGPGWRHSDDDLVGAVRDGHFPGVGRDPRSRMPAFGPLMPPDDILAAVAFTKARWPVGLLVSQAALNPGGRGVPRQVTPDWRFPPDCKPP